MRFLKFLTILLAMPPSLVVALEPEKFLPPDTVFVAMVRPKPVMASALFKKAFLPTGDVNIFLYLSLTFL